MQKFTVRVFLVTSFHSAIKQNPSNMTLDGTIKSFRLLGGCQITERLLAYCNIAAVLHKMVGLERMLDYRGDGLQRFQHMIHLYYYIQCSLPNPAPL